MTMDKSERNDLLEIIGRFNGVPLLVVGDVILDHYIWGSVERISPEAPVVVVQVERESKSPGGAGNVAQNLAKLGANAFLCGVVGGDSGGVEILSLLKSGGVNTDYILTSSSRPTTTKTRIVARSQQVVRVDRESKDPIDEEEALFLHSNTKKLISSANAIIVSDYAKGVVTEGLFAIFQEGINQRSIGLGQIPLIVDPKGPNTELYHGASLIKPNRKEAEQASGLIIHDTASAIKAAWKLKESWETEVLMITLGELGMILVSDSPGEQEIAIPTFARDVFDVSGAGDTVSAVFSLALASGGTLRQAAQLANFAAGIVVGKVGTVSVSSEELFEVISGEGK